MVFLIDSVPSLNSAHDFGSYEPTSVHQLFIDAVGPKETHGSISRVLGYGLGGLGLIPGLGHAQSL